jgi:hypothetical protein
MTVRGTAAAAATTTTTKTWTKKRISNLWNICLGLSAHQHLLS